MSKISFLPSLVLFKWDKGVTSCVTKLVVLSYRNKKKCVRNEIIFNEAKEVNQIYQLGGEKLGLELDKNYLFTRLPNLEGSRKYFFACRRRHVLRDKMAPSIVKIILLNEMTKSKYSIISKSHNIKKA